MTKDNNIICMDIIQELFDTYDVSLSIHQETYDEYSYYIVMACWNYDKGFNSITSSGESIADAVYNVFSEIKKLDK